MAAAAVDLVEEAGEDAEFSGAADHTLIHTATVRRSPPPGEVTIAYRKVIRVFVVIRFRVGEAEQAAFGERLQAAVDVLALQKGFVAARTGRNVDDPELLALTLEFENIGSYRRALSPYDVKVAAVPLLSEALDEPTAYEDLPG